jgi:hypothetical protein
LLDDRFALGCGGKREPLAVSPGILAPRSHSFFLVVSTSRENTIPFLMASRGIALSSRKVERAGIAARKRRREPNRSTWIAPSGTTSVTSAMLIIVCVDVAPGGRASGSF